MCSSDLQYTLLSRVAALILATITDLLKLRRAIFVLHVPQVAVYCFLNYPRLALFCLDGIKLKPFDELSINPDIELLGYSFRSALSVASIDWRSMKRILNHSSSTFLRFA